MKLEFKHNICENNINLCLLTIGYDEGIVLLVCFDKGYVLEFTPRASANTH